MSAPRHRTSAQRAATRVAAHPLGPVSIQRVQSARQTAPPLLIEAVYLGVLVYGMVAPGLGIYVPMLGSVMLLLLAGICVVSLGSRVTAIFAPIRLAIICALSVLVVEIGVHGGSLTGNASRGFIVWILALVVIQSLSLRPGFLERCVSVLWGMGLMGLPYLTVNVAERVAVDRGIVSGDFNNSNGLGDWFGFCCLWFTVLAIETKRNGVRLVSIFAALVSFYIVGLSVSRGALLGTALGATVAFRRILGRGFVPVLTAVVLGGTVFVSGALDDAVSRYVSRGTEDSGRLLVWPLAIERVTQSPVLGVGADNVDTYVPAEGRPISPHNSFIWFALASGIIPFILFSTWWIKAAQNSVSYGERSPYGAFRLPLLLHIFVVTMLGDFAFMQPWGVVTFCLAMARNDRYGVRRFVVRPMPRHVRSRRESLSQTESLPGAISAVADSRPT